MKIEVLGSGCARCVATENNIKEAIKQLGIQAEVIKVTNIAEFADKGIIFTPGVIINGKVMFSGKIPAVDEIKKAISSI